MKKVARKIEAYRGTAGWLIRDFVRVLRFRLALHALLSAAVVVARFATFGGFLLYAQEKVTGTPLAIGGISVEVLHNPQFLLPIVFLSALAMSVLGFFEARYRIALASDYSGSIIRRILEKLASRSPKASAYLSRRSKQYVVRLLGGDAWSVMRAALPVLGAVLPAIQLLVASGIMLMLSWLLSLMLGLLLLAYIAPYYLLNRRIVRASREREEVLPGFRRASLSVVNSLDTVTTDAARKAAIDDFMNGKSFHASRENFSVLRTTNAAVRSLNGIFLALFLVVLVGFVEWFEPQNVMISLLVYAVVLLHAYTALNALTGAAVAFNRFLPQFSRCTALLTLEGAAGSPSTPFASQDGEFNDVLDEEEQ
jgi:ABC-type multidrug transport system fused ATPase/permease subunit